jgi:NTE family protein
MCFWWKKKKKYRIGLALGSGGARGLAHIGVIKILEENDIPIHCIAGSSIGAMVGGLYAAERNIGSIERLALDNNWRKLLSLIIEPSVGGGVIGGKKIESFLKKELDGAKFSDLKIPFSAVATNFETGQPVILSRGDVAKAISCSLSVPLIFKPKKHEGQVLVDGGLSEPVPIEAARKMGADFVIAVNLDYCLPGEKKGVGFWEAGEDSLEILRYHLAKEKIKQADVVVEPKIKFKGLIGWRKFFDGRKFIPEGERAMREVLPKLKKLIGY